MKSKKKSKSKTRSKSKPRSRARAHSRPRTKTSRVPSLEAPSSPTTSVNTLLKTCQEIEVGDIGGFGSTIELEEHEKRCSEQATEFCANCGKNLCHNHYDLLHRDHDRSSGSISPSPA